ncbi:hypothetical protein BX600DRAFT_436191 [Xylariales sp. PMI_506]|nr:hypothetical protein BX600DRAFT_436191 [Xylariales sp. PMI_506]
MQPMGVGIVVLTFCIFFSVLSLIVVSLRVWVRGRSKMLGWDDALMVIGLLLYLATAVLAGYATFHGLGGPPNRVSSSMNTQGVKYTMIWQLVYIPSVVFIKNSICITLLRIAVERAHRWALYVTIGISTAVSITGFVGLISSCRPISAQWIIGAGTCAPRTIVTSMYYVVSAGAVVTDWACAVIPVFILWKSQMRRKVKISVATVLALGSLASLSTFARLPYLQFYADTDNFLYQVGNIVLWSMFEGGIGLIAGSMPMLRLFFHRWIGGSTHTDTHDTPHLPTIGGTERARYTFSNSGRPHISVRNSKTREDRGWEALYDSSTEQLPSPESAVIRESRYEMQQLKHSGNVV